MRAMLLRLIPVVILSLAATAVGQDFNLYGFSTVDYSFPGSGARALGMGGAFTGVADDASALTWNPAGLVQVDRTQASVAGTYRLPEQKTTITYRAGSPSDFSAKKDQNKLKLNYASFVAPLRVKGHPFMMSATYRSPEDRIEDLYSWSSVDQTYVTAAGDTVDFTALRSSHTTITGGLDIFSFGFGTGLYGDLSIGGAINIYSGSGEALFRNQYIDTATSSFAGMADTIELIRTQSVDDILSTKGFNFVGSVFYRKGVIRAGVKIETPFDLITDHDVARRDTLYENTLPTFPIGSRAWLYRGKTKIQMPVVVSGGLSVTPKPDLTLAGDFQVWRFSNAKYLIERDTLFTQRGSIYFPYHCIDADTCAFSNFTSSGTREEVYDEFDIGLRNSVAFRVGAEYLLHTKLGIIPLRAGGSLTKMQYTDVTNVTRDALDQVQTGFVLGDRVSRKSFSFGTGIHWRQIWFDLAFNYATQEQKESGTNTLGSYETTRKINQPSGMLNFTGFF